MALMHSYLHYNGNAEEAFNFYKSVFGGNFEKIIRFKDIASPENPIQETEANKIMQISLVIGKNTLMGSDVPESMGRINENENRFKISIRAESYQEASKIANGLSNAGLIEVLDEGNEENSYFAMLRDQYGIEWMIEFDAKTAIN